MNPSSGPERPVAWVRQFRIPLLLPLFRWMGTPARWVKTHRHRIGLVMVGHTAKQVEEYLFDWLIYGLVAFYATETFGLVYGSAVTFAIMAPLSAGLCYLYLRLYDWLKKDWFGLEALKLVQEGGLGEGWFARIITRVARAGRVPAFFALSIYGDPFLTTVYLRQGSGQYNGFCKTDWRIFWASVLFANAYWSLRWVVIVELVRVVWRFFS